MVKSATQPDPESSFTGVCRSLLVTPALRVDRLTAPSALDADIHLIDLEDAVPPTRKDEARHLVLSLDPHLVPARFGVRINSVRTADGVRDLCMLLNAPAVPEVIVLPKAECAADVQLVDEILTTAASPARLWVIVETVAGVEAVSSIARSCERLSALTFGAADFCAETGVAMDWEALVFPRSQIALAARAAGVEAIDGPTFALDDPELLELDARRALALGYTGKVAVHPKQLEMIHRVFTPTEAEVAKASRIVHAFATTRDGIVTLDGCMLGPPFLRQAERVLARAGIAP